MTAMSATFGCTAAWPGCSAATFPRCTRTSAFRRWGGARLRQVDRLEVLERGHPLGAELAAQSAGLDAAERRARVERIAFDADAPGLHPPGHLHATLAVPGPPTSSQPVL